MRHEKIGFLFDRFAKDYEGYMTETSHIQAQDSIIETFLPQINGNVLDIATGTGTIAKYIKEKTQCKVHGIDYSFEMIMEAKKSFDEIDFGVGDVHNLPYQNNFFDVVTCSYGFYWFQSIERAIAEVKRVLKPRGLFILLEEEFKEGHKPKPKFSEKGNYLKELASLENYVGVDYLKHKLKDAHFNLIQEATFCVDEVHATIGMMYQKEAA